MLGRQPLLRMITQKKKDYFVELMSRMFKVKP